MCSSSPGDQLHGLIGRASPLQPRKGWKVGVNVPMVKGLSQPLGDPVLGSACATVAPALQGGRRQNALFHHVGKSCRHLWRGARGLVCGVCWRWRHLHPHYLPPHHVLDRDLTQSPVRVPPPSHPIGRGRPTTPETNRHPPPQLRIVCACGCPALPDPFLHHALPRCWACLGHLWATC